MLPFILEEEEKICICLYLYKKLLEGIIKLLALGDNTGNESSLYTHS